MPSVFGLKGAKALTSIVATLDIVELVDLEGKRLAKPDACPTEIYQIMYSCWLHRPQDRPTFASLAQYLNGKTLDMLKAAKPCNEEGKLKVQEGDDIIIIDGWLDHYWWTGQNQRTCEIGQFPRVHATSGRRKKQSDISNPLRHSFVHTGHGDVNPRKTFGSPAVLTTSFSATPFPRCDLNYSDISVSSARLVQHNLHKDRRNLSTRAPISFVQSSPVQLQIQTASRVTSPHFFFHPRNLRIRPKTISKTSISSKPRRFSSWMTPSIAAWWNRA